MTTLRHASRRKAPVLEAVPTPVEVPGRLRRQPRSPDAALKLVGVRLPSDVHAALVQLAIMRRRSLSAQVELVIEHGMREIGLLPNDQALDDDDDD